MTEFTHEIREAAARARAHKPGADPIADYAALWMVIMVERGVAKPMANGNGTTMTYDTGEEGLCEAFADMDAQCPEGFAMMERRLTDAVEQ